MIRPTVKNKRGWKGTWQDLTTVHYGSTVVLRTCSTLPPSLQILLVQLVVRPTCTAPILAHHRQEEPKKACMDLNSMPPRSEMDGLPKRPLRPSDKKKLTGSHIRVTLTHIHDDKTYSKEKKRLEGNLTRPHHSALRVYSGLEDLQYPATFIALVVRPTCTAPILAHRRQEEPKRACMDFNPLHSRSQMDASTLGYWGCQTKLNGSHIHVTLAQIHADKTHWIKKKKTSESTVALKLPAQYCGPCSALLPS